jgi:hypothetical protein
MRDPAELCGRIEQSIREFGSEPAQAPPEETLALLASSANDPAPAARVSEVNVESNGVADALVTTDSLESASQPTAEGRKRAIGLWIVAGLVCAIAAAWWFLR